MSNLEAWKYIIENWHCSQWTSIPQNIKDCLGLDSRLGMISGMLVTRQGSKGLEDFVNRLNEKSL